MLRIAVEHPLHTGKNGKESRFPCYSAGLGRSAHWRIRVDILLLEAATEVVKGTRSFGT